MKVWIGGELDSPIADGFRIARNRVEENVNALLTKATYGDGLANLDIIIVISKDPGKEVYKYSQKKRETDVRIILDYDLFINADLVGRCNSIIGALVRAVTEVVAKYKIKEIDFEGLVRDLTALRIDE